MLAQFGSLRLMNTNKEFDRIHQVNSLYESPLSKACIDSLSLKSLRLSTNEASIPRKIIC